MKSPGNARFKAQRLGDVESWGFPGDDIVEPRRPAYIVGDGET